jgi:hypothetical protein
MISFNTSCERIIVCINDLLPSIERKDSPDLPFNVAIVLGENIFSYSTSVNLAIIF